MPESCHQSHLMIAFSNKAGAKRIVGKDTGLGQTMTLSANFEVYPAIAVKKSTSGDKIYLLDL